MRSTLFAAIVAFGAVIGMNGCGGSGSSFSAPSSIPPSGKGPQGSPIAHVVMIVQENRSFDNLFALFPGADGAKRGLMKVKSHGKYVDRWQKLQPHSLIMSSDIQHCHASFLTDWDNGKMDGFDLSALGVCPNGTKFAGKVPYQYVQQSDIQPYWDIADQWVLADHLFQTQGSGSFTAHQDLIRGGTHITVNESIIDNPRQMPWGCDHVGTSKVDPTSLITNAGKYLKDQGPVPCTNDFPYSGSKYATLATLMDAKNVKWKYYVPCFVGWNQNNCDKGCPNTCAGSTLNAFDVIYSVRYGPEWGTNVSMPETNIFTDITNQSLPAMSWVMPEDNDDDHPGESVDYGPSWVASVVNAIGNSPYWKSSVIIVLWDDWGGFYDSAAPPKQNTQGGLGFRVPMLIISPYAKEGTSSQGGYVSHTQYEFGSLMKYIEENFGLGSLHTTDTGANSIGDSLDYTQSPREFHTIPSQKTVDFFEHLPHTVSHGDPQ
ncbi:MAG: hypothetical protein JO351_08170 [Candidatus Eremiobacteraeota bacterium]|nr:hypothetical protein [Candidatus Eremiobacteraeota bacterium]